MTQMVFINLPVSDVAKATVFYQALGSTLNPQFSNPQASAMVWSDTIVTMLLHRDFFATFTDRPVADAKTVTAALTCLSRDSRADVDLMAERALAAGGREPRPAQDHGFMYGRSIEDPDGHIIEAMWMDVGAAANDGAHTITA